MCALVVYEMLHGQGHWAYGRVGSEVFGSKPHEAITTIKLHVYDFEHGWFNSRHGGNACQNRRYR